MREESFLPNQETDSSPASSYDLPGKGAKLGYYILVHDYVYVLLLFLRFQMFWGFRSEMIESLESDVFTDEIRNKLFCCVG